VSEPANKVNGTPASAVSGVRARVPVPLESAAGVAHDPLRVGRYVVGERIAAGGMATVHIGRLRGAAGFSRTVAIKRLMPQFANDPEFEGLFVHEARLVARIQHPNVVATLDAVAEQGELLLVMDYVQGEPLARLMQTAAERDGGVPQPIALSIIRDTLCGLHAAHEARDRHGNPLDIVHRDISPQNLMVGSDGVTRVLDFGIAKAASSVEHTREGMVRGKTAYMAPEQILSEPITRRADIYAVGIVLWELLVGERLFPGGVRRELMLGEPSVIAPPSVRGATSDPRLDAIVLRALAGKDTERFETAQQMADQLGASFSFASREEVAAWVRKIGDETLKKRAAVVARLESAEVSLLPPPSIQGEPAFVAADALSNPGSAAAPERNITPAGAAPGRFRSRAATWVVLAAVSAGVSIGAVMALRGAAQPASPHAAPVAGADSTPTSAPPPASSAALEKSPPLPLNNDSEPPLADKLSGATEPVPAAPSAASAASGARASHKLRNTAGRAKPANKSKPDCTPPYTVDAAGRRHFKLECF